MASLERSPRLQYNLGDDSRVNRALIMWPRPKQIQSFVSSSFTLWSD
jgi:hypothetical protein